MRGKPPRLQPVPQFHSQEGAGRVPGDLLVKARDHVFHRIGIVVDQFRQNGKVVVVDDRVHLPAQRAQDRFRLGPDLHDILQRPDMKALEIDVEDVRGGVILQPLGDRFVEKIFFQIHGRQPEDPLVHRLRVLHDRLEIHVGQDVLFQVHAGGDLRQFHAFIGQGEDAALRNEYHIEIVHPRRFAAEGHLFDIAYEFLHAPFFYDWSFPSSTATFVPPAVKVPTKTIFFAFWLMSMNPPQPASLGPKRLTFTFP